MNTLMAVADDCAAGTGVLAAGARRTTIGLGLSGHAASPSRSTACI